MNSGSCCFLFLCLFWDVCVLIHLSQESVCLWLDYKDISRYVIHGLSHHLFVQAACCVGGPLAWMSALSSAKKAPAKAGMLSPRGCTPTTSCFLAHDLRLRDGLQRFTSDLLLHGEFHIDITANHPIKVVD